METLKEFIRSVVVKILILEARAVLRKYKPAIIVVTGSVGKTSTKDAAYAALSSVYFVRKSEKSFNSDIGVPLTVLGVPNGWSNPFIWFKNIVEGLSLIFVNVPYPKWLVVEVGADRPGDITRSLSWLRPRAVLTTRFPDVPVHVEFYESPEDVVREEAAPIAWLSDGGVLITHTGNEERIAHISVPESVQKITYGFDSHAEVRGTHYIVRTKNKMPAGIAFDVLYKNEREHISLSGVIGRPHADAILAGIAAAVGVGVPFQKAAGAFHEYAPPAARARLIQGTNGSVVIDDSYNSSPVASEEALLSLKDAPRGGKRIAVLADMLELGMYAVPEHKRIGTIAAASCDLLVTVGVRARDIAKAAREAGMATDAIIECGTGSDAMSIIPSLIGEGDIILIKGSQSMRMERVVKGLMAEPHKARELLVRHDTEWLLRP